MIQVLHRAFNIMEYIAKNPKQEHALRDIANAFNMNHATCANILKTMVNRGYIEQVGQKKGYKLGYMTYQVADSPSYYDDLILASDEALLNLMTEINESVILSVVKHDKRLVLKQMTCSHEIQVRTSNQTSVYRATSGRLLLAYYSAEELEVFIKRNGMPTEADDWSEVQTKEDLEQQLSLIRKQGFCISQNRSAVIGLAVPILRKGKTIASIGIYLPAMRFGQQEKERLLKAMRGAVQNTESKL